MEAKTVIEVTKKLIGNVEPYGATHIDDKRFENLKVLCKVVNELISDINYVAQQKDRHEHSIKEMGEYAYNFLQDELLIFTE